ncbi:hypothetical protein PMAYCL1PPCAC_01702, partial [Pristionchus mayeri]
VGFAVYMGAKMMANKKYCTHVAAIVKAMNNQQEEVPYSRMDAKMEIFKWSKNDSQIVDWKVDMVCEMFDTLDQCQNVLKA